MQSLHDRRTRRVYARHLVADHVQARPGGGDGGRVLPRKQRRDQQPPDPAG